mmetsp:Transcript_5148/g.7868  ORF Transcript_5148/g.7868 Transcript_5148/m.7868 type:complete len:901 (-) Transcript_5148:238-2940(-)
MPKLGFSGVRTRQRSSTELANGEAAKANDNNPLLSSDNSGGMSSSGENSELIGSSYVTMTNGKGTDKNASSSKPGGKKPVDVRNALVRFFFPSTERIKCTTFISLTLMTAIPPLIYIFFFTKMGYGARSFYYLSEKYQQYASSLLGGLGGLFCLLYIFDFTEWKSKLGKVLKDVFIVVLVSGVCLWFLFQTGYRPYGPICLFLLMTPMWLVAMKIIFYPHKPTKIFVSWLGGPLFFVSTIVLGLWIAWSFAADENEWSEITEWHGAEEVGCVPDLETYPECASRRNEERICFEVSLDENKVYYENNCPEYCPDYVFSTCLNTFILWSGPLLVSLGLFFLSFFSTFLRDDSVEEDVSNFGKLWLVLLFAMWVIASMSGVSAGLSAAMIAFTLAAFMASAVFLACSYSKTEIKSQRSEYMQRFEQKYGAHFNVLKGLFVITCLPIVVMYIFLSFLNQCVRRCGVFPCSSKITPETDDSGKKLKTSWVTEKTAAHIEQFKSWDRTTVYTNAIYWGIGFLTLHVLVAQFTMLFLSYLIDVTSTMRLWVVTLILLGVGLVMFLLPPVPGVPIYLTMGIVLVAIGKENMGIVGAIFYCVTLSLGLKLFACTCQQKLIGERLSGNVKVRSFVGINSNIIRSMRLILTDPGLSAAKCAILVGGPDWPTSVLCGIMSLNIWPILVGTLPVVFLIAPTVLTGSFTYMSGLITDGKPDFPWAGTAAAVMAAFTACIQFGSMLLAAMFVGRVANTRAEELAAVPYDEPVLELEEKSKEIDRLYRELTAWGVLPLGIKIILNLAIWCMVSACYMVQLWYDDCFEEFFLTSSIADELDGDWTNLVTETGRVALLLFCISLFFFQLFRTWAKRKTKVNFKKGVISPENGQAEDTTPIVGDLEQNSASGNSFIVSQ